MSARRRLPAVPATALAVLVAAGVLAGCADGSYHVTATFDDVGDMVVRHSVQMADIRIGHISSIELTDDFKARVTLAIDDGVRVPAASKAIVAKTSLLGEQYVELRPEGDPDTGPFLADGDDLGRGVESPELEFVAEQAANLLGAVVADDVATIIDVGATAFGGRAEDLRSIVADLETISASFADRTDELTRIIDGLDRAMGTLAGGTGDVQALLTNLADTTTILAAKRTEAIDALAALSRLAAVQNDLLDRYRSDMDRQIGQVEAILGQVAASGAEVGSLLEWLEQFVVALPKGIPGDFTQVYMWAVPQSEDARSNGGGS